MAGRSRVSNGIHWYLIGQGEDHPATHMGRPEDAGFYQKIAYQRHHERKYKQLANSLKEINSRRQRNISSGEVPWH